jgi:hypothetical protein
MYGFVDLCKVALSYVKFYFGKMFTGNSRRKAVELPLLSRSEAVTEPSKSRRKAVNRL